MRKICAILVTGIALLLVGCATADTSGVNDPYEGTNRKIFNFNHKLDTAVMKPVAKAYVWITPDPLQDGIHNFLGNLDEPITFANNLLQADIKRGADTVARFTVNSTIGIGGLINVASKIGIPADKEDFGLTLAHWGVGEGPYLVLPFVGPDPPRDAGGQVVDIFFDPLTYIDLREKFWWSAGRGALSVIDLRARNLDTLDSIERQSVDFYASVRSLYRQNRNNDIRHGEPDINNLPDL